MHDIYAELESFVLEHIHPNASKESLQHSLESEEQLLKLLSPAQRTAYETYQSANLNYDCEYESTLFRAGFRLGAQLMCDVLHKPA